MAHAAYARDAQEPAKASLLYDPKVRSIVFQVVLVLALIFVRLVDRRQHDRQPPAHEHHLRLRLPARRAGFAIGDSLIAVHPRHDLRPRILVGFFNTLLVAVIGIIIATILGFLIGIGRLSSQLAAA